MTRHRAVELARKLKTRRDDESSSAGERLTASRALERLMVRWTLSEEEIEPPRLKMLLTFDLDHLWRACLLQLVALIYDVEANAGEVSDRVIVTLRGPTPLVREAHRNWQAAQDLVLGEWRLVQPLLLGVGYEEVDFGMSFIAGFHRTALRLRTSRRRAEHKPPIALLTESVDGAPFGASPGPVASAAEEPAEYAEAQVETPKPPLELPEWDMIPIALAIGQAMTWPPKINRKELR